MSGNSGFSGFGGRPDLDEEEGYDKKDESRDRRGKYFFNQSDFHLTYLTLYPSRKNVPGACYSVKSG